MPRLTKIYTRKGDDGSTGLGGGQQPLELVPLQPVGAGRGDRVEVEQAEGRGEVLNLVVLVGRRVIPRLHGEQVGDGLFQAGGFGVSVRHGGYSRGRAGQPVPP